MADVDSAPGSHSASSPAPRKVMSWQARAVCGAKAYQRMRDLPRLLPLWPWEIADDSIKGTRRIVAALRKALRAERRRGMAGHWSYDLARHMALIAALKAEKQRLVRMEGDSASASRKGGEE